VSVTSSLSTLTLTLLGSGESAFYSRWEADVEATAATLPGFLEAESFRPVAGLQERWVLVLRFDGQAGVLAWKGSEQRTALLEQASALDPQEQVITGAGSVKRPVTVLVNTRVKPENEAAFRAFQAEISERQRSFPGYIDGKLLAPVPGVTDVWTITMRFDTDEHLENWLNSSERRELMASVDAPLRGEAPKKVIADLGGWFQVKSTEEPPSNWKQALCVLLPLYPTVLALTLLALPNRIWPAVPFALALLINNVISMILLTWVFMPPLTGYLQFWLQPALDQPRSKERNATIAILGVLLLQLIVFLKVA
jgi:antibiotic biosynthesis monooxygenase (ABM) superfamily enzyme